MNNLYATRSNETELMDDLTSGGEEMRLTLRELGIINSLLGGNRVTLNSIKQLIDLNVNKTWRIMDIGCGDGGILKHIARWARRKSLKVELVGIDANPNVISFAEENCREFAEISFRTQNIFSPEFRSETCDILTATLFLHHFTNSELVKLFQQFKSQARVGLAINDLHRHWFAYLSIKVLTSLFSKSPMVKNDGGISVLRAFHRQELENILHDAHIDTITFRWMWAFRWQVVARTV